MFFFLLFRPITENHSGGKAPPSSLFPTTHTAKGYFGSRDSDEKSTFSFLLALDLQTLFISRHVFDWKINSSTSNSSFQRREEYINVYTSTRDVDPLRHQLIKENKNATCTLEMWDTRGTLNGGLSNEEGFLVLYSHVKFPCCYCERGESCLVEFGPLNRQGHSQLLITQTG